MRKFNDIHAATQLKSISGKNMEIALTSICKIYIFFLSLSLFGFAVVRIHAKLIIGTLLRSPPTRFVNSNRCDCRAWMCPIFGSQSIDALNSILFFYRIDWILHYSWFGWLRNRFLLRINFIDTTLEVGVRSFDYKNHLNRPRFYSHWFPCFIFFIISLTRCRLWTVIISQIH